MLPQLDDLYQRCEPDPPSTIELQQTFLQTLRFISKTSTVSCITDHIESDEESSIDDFSHTYIVLDGVDEVQYGPKRNAIIKLLRLISALGLPGLHLLVSSRREVDIETALTCLDRWQPLHITQQSVEMDLNIFVTNQISDSQKLRSQPEHVKDEIKHRLVGGANGMYVNVALHIMVLLMALQVPLDCTSDARVEQKACSPISWHYGCPDFFAKGPPRNIRPNSE